MSSMAGEYDVMFLHVHKQHIYEPIAGAVAAGLKTAFVTPLYNRGLTRLVFGGAPGPVGRMVRQHADERLAAADIHSGFPWSLARLFINYAWRREESRFFKAFDRWCAARIRKGRFRSRIFYVFQDYLPRTCLAVKEAGALLVAEQILNNSPAAQQRVIDSTRQVSFPVHCPEYPSDQSVNERLLGLANRVVVPSSYVRRDIEGPAGADKIWQVPYGAQPHRPASAAVQRRVDCRLRWGASDPRRRLGQQREKRRALIARGSVTGRGVLIPWFLRPDRVSPAGQPRSAIPACRREGPCVVSTGEDNARLHSALRGCRAAGRRGFLYVSLSVRGHVAGHARGRGNRPSARDNSLLRAGCVCERGSWRPYRRTFARRCRRGHPRDVSATEQVARFWAGRARHHQRPSLVGIRAANRRKPSFPSPVKIILRAPSAGFGNILIQFLFYFAAACLFASLAAPRDSYTLVNSIISRTPGFPCSLSSAALAAKRNDKVAMLAAVIPHSLCVSFRLPHCLKDNTDGTGAYHGLDA